MLLSLMYFVLITMQNNYIISTICYCLIRKCMAKLELTHPDSNYEHSLEHSVRIGANPSTTHSILRIRRSVTHRVASILRKKSSRYPLDLTEPLFEE